MKKKQVTAFGFKEMCILAIATSIDALAIGITFAFLRVNILASASLIAVITFVISMARSSNWK